MSNDASPNVDHIGLAVTDLDQAIAQFTRALPGSVEFVDAPAGGARIAFLRLGNCDFELVQPTSPDHPMAAWLAEHGPGIHHIAVASLDIEASAKTLAEKGVGLRDPSPTPGARQSRVVNLDPGSLAGIAVQLVQRQSSSIVEARE